MPVECPEWMEKIRYGEDNVDMLATECVALPVPDPLLCVGPTALGATAVPARVETLFREIAGIAFHSVNALRRGAAGNDTVRGACFTPGHDPGTGVLREMPGKDRLNNAFGHPLRDDD